MCLAPWLFRFNLKLRSSSLQLGSWCFSVRQGRVLNRLVGQEKSCRFGPVGSRREGRFPGDSGAPGPRRIVKGRGVGVGAELLGCGDAYL